MRRLGVLSGIIRTSTASSSSSSSSSGSSLVRASRLFCTTTAAAPEGSPPGADASTAAQYEVEVADVLKEYEERQKRKQALVGTIVSTKNTKSITVQVVREKYFSKYNKSMNARKKIMVHDEHELGNLGDIVRIVPCRPMSKMKRHQLIDVLKKNIV